MLLYDWNYTLLTQKSKLRHSHRINEKSVPVERKKKTIEMTVGSDTFALSKAALGISNRIVQLVKHRKNLKRIHGKMHHSMQSTC